MNARLTATAAVFAVTTAGAARAQTAPAGAPAPMPAQATAATAAQPAAPPAPPPPASSDAPRFELTSMRLLLAKGIITQAEYDAALRDMADSNGARAGDSTSLVVGKWSTTIYGFVEADAIYDSTESFGDLAGNAQVQRPGPAQLPTGGPHYAAEHGRTQFSIRNSRLGFRMRAPESTSGVRLTGQLELDLLGNQAGTPPSAAVSEGSYFTNAAMRVRHANVRIETPVVDLLIGQYWHLFGWQPVYHPNTVEIQGVPGQIYSRTVQLRLSKTIKTEAITFEAAVAAMRPPQRDSEAPEGEAGLRLAVNKWTGMATAGATGTALQPLSIAVSGDYRHYGVPELLQIPTKQVNKDTTALAVDAFIPVLPATKDKKGNSLSLNGEFVSGYGMADLYTGLTGGVSVPTIPNATRQNPPLPYPQNFDNGLVTFDNNGDLHGIQWTSFMVGLQYYLPGLDGRMWISGNYAHTDSSNAGNFTTNQPANPANINYVNVTQVRASEDWWDVNVFGDVRDGLRLGAEYANFNDRYADGIHAINHRVQVSAFFIF